MWELSVDGGAPRRLWPGAEGRVDGGRLHFVFDREEHGAFRRDLFAERECRWPAWRSQHQENLTVGPLCIWPAGSSRDGRRLFAYGRAGRGEPMRFDPATNTFAPALGGESAI